MVSGGSAIEEKKAVCKALTSVVKASPLAIDPKAFFIMLHTNYALVRQGDRLDLTPVWEALTAAHTPEALYGLFLKLQEKGTSLNLQVSLPPVFDQLTPEQRAEALGPFKGMSIPDDPSGLEPLPLATGDIRPIIPEERRRAIVSAVATGLRSSPLSRKYDASQLTFAIDSSFDELCDGRTFDFAPLLAGLEQEGPVDHRHFYEAILRAASALEELGITPKEPKLELNAIDKQNVADEMRRADARAAQERAASLERPPEAPVETPKRATSSKADRLKELGLAADNKKKQRPIRLAVLSAILVAGALLAYFTRPNRPLDAKEYDAVIPMTKAEIQDRTFQCTVDEKRWLKLPLAERADRLKRFEAMLREQGYISEMQCRDSKGRLAIIAKGLGSLAGAPYFMKGNEQGEIERLAPPEELQEARKD